jgi:glycosyltransferase involved in cell wall biosynthesis
MAQRSGRTAGEPAGHGGRARSASRRLEPAERDGATEQSELTRGQCVVCIALEGPPDRFALCLRSVVANTPGDVVIHVAETRSSDPGIAKITRSFAPGRRIERTAPSPSGPAPSLAAAIASAAPADVLLLHSDCIVGKDWYEQMRSAAYSDSNAASANALSNDAGLLSVPERNGPNPLPPGLTAAEASAAVAAHSLRIYPRLPVAVGRATYMRRDALDLAGGFDPALASVEAAVVDFSQRCIALGLVHVAADDTYVYFHSLGKRAPDESLRVREATEDPLIVARYPYLSPALGESEQAQDRPLPIVLARARRAVNGLSLTVDARCLVAPATGTHVIVLESIRALARLDALQLRAVVPHDLADFAAAGLAELGIELIDASGNLSELRGGDVIYRPFQVSSSADLELLGKLGERLVITHLDLIAYDNPSYFPSFLHWQHYRMLTRIALARADRVTFLSHDAAGEALAEQLVEPRQAVVVHPGVTHSFSAGGARERPPATDRLGDRPFLVSIGTDLHHKNRIFALELLAAMRRDHGWPGAIVFAGPCAAQGSSAGEEARFIAANPDLAEFVVTLQWVSEAQKSWLIENSVAVCHPSTREGLGLMPFEAAAHGRPCIFASTTALAEMQPEGLATITQWDAFASAARVMRLLADDEAIAEHVRRTNARAAELSWGRTAERLLEVFEDAMAAPSRDARRVADDLARSEIDRAEIHRKYDELWRALSADGHALTGPNGLLDAMDQRALLTVAGRRWLRRIVIGQARLLQGLVRNPAPLPPPPTTDPEIFDMHFREANVNHMRTHLLEQNDPDGTH